MMPKVHRATVERDVVPGVYIVEATILVEADSPGDALQTVEAALQGVPGELVR